MRGRKGALGPVAALGAVLAMTQGAGAQESRFEDVPDGHLFAPAITWLADQEITRGCNPPTNDRFCPDDFVTRGQMAAFLVRTLFLEDGQGSDRFTDDDPSVFEADIERLAQAGVTRGCNPPQNDRFCPDDPVTRGQMAAFLHRAFGSPDVGEPGHNRIDPDHTLLPSPDQVDFVHYQPDGVSTLEYRGEVEVDDVIVMGVTPETPWGFLGTVTAVDGATVTTEPGTLTDVMPAGSFSLSTADVEPQSGGLSLQSSHGPSGSFECSGSIVSIDGSAYDLALGEFYMDADWGLTSSGLPRVHSLDTGWDVRASGEFDGTFGPGFHCSSTHPWEGPLLGVWQFQFGFPPVPIVVILRSGVDLRWNASVEAGATLDAAYEVGYRANTAYRDGNWAREHEAFRDFTSGELTFSSQGSAELEFLPRIRGEIYALAGPHVRAGPYLNAEIEPTADPWWTLDGGISASLGVSLNRWFFHLDSDFAEVRLLNVRIAQSTSPPPDPPPDPPPPAPSYVHSWPEPTELFAVEDDTETLVGTVQVDTRFPALLDVALSEGGDLYGVGTYLSDFDRALYQIDPSTAEATLIGTTVDGANALTFSPDGELLAATDTGDFAQIDPDTGTATVIGPLGTGITSSGDLAFHPDGTLYLTAKVPAQVSDVLMTVDPSTGAATPVDEEQVIGADFNNVYGLAFDGDTLLGYVENDLTGCPTGSVIDIDVSTGVGSLLRCLDFAPGGAT